MGYLSGNEGILDLLAISGAWLFKPRIHRDTRGGFHEWFRDAEFLNDIGYRFELGQANCSVPRCGVNSGIIFSWNW